MPSPAAPLTGLVHRGRVLPGTDWILRDPRAWWPPTSSDVMARGRGVEHDLLVGHWTGGHPHVGPDAARTLVRRMDARRGEDGGDLRVSVHFTIDGDGVVYQLADLSIATVHVGWRPWIVRSVGVEVCHPGTLKQAEALGLDGYVPTLRPVGKAVLVAARFRPAQLASWVRLAETLAEHLGIPRVVPASTARMTAARARRWVGAAEHLHSPASAKLDAAGFLADALRDAGWASREP